MKNRFFTQFLQDTIRQFLRHPKYRAFTIVAGLLYLISPLDISPDVFPIVGWIDDGLIASLVVAEISHIAVEQLKNRKKITLNQSKPLPKNAVIDVTATSLN